MTQKQDHSYPVDEKIKNPEGKKVKLPRPYEVFFVPKGPTLGEIIIHTREHVLSASDFNKKEKPEWVKKLLDHTEISFITVEPHSIKIEISTQSFDDVWNNIKERLEVEVLNDL
ncbi:MAG: hypothetical protein KAS07_01500 [Candidatus Pacebacteria bacterium]|nr:hypothetical protein [Candidatus Paceibacterota bacterium]